MTADRSKSAQFLKDVSPLGAPLTEAQSAHYKTLLIEEGIHTADVDGLLGELNNIGRTQSSPELCKIKGHEPKP